MGLEGRRILEGKTDVIISVFVPGGNGSGGFLGLAGRQGDGGGFEGAGGFGTGIGNWRSGILAELLGGEDDGGAEEENGDDSDDDDENSAFVIGGRDSGDG